MSSMTNGRRTIAWVTLALYLIAALLGIWITLALSGHSMADVFHR
jgi:hypothetical protein